jgi:hypothetical protein
MSIKGPRSTWFCSPLTRCCQTSFDALIGRTLDELAKNGFHTGSAGIAQLLQSG